MKRQRNPLLKLPSLLYGLGVGVRNWAFNMGLLTSLKSDIPTICIGNLSAGGTGKTPHILWFIRQLQPHYRVAVLSRGYGRKTKGPLIATPQHTAQEIGDEPALILSLYPKVLVYIDGNRRRALTAMEAMPPNQRPEVVLMDDGFQHRYITPAYSILLTPYHTPFTRDSLLPYGNLREPANVGKNRADTVIITSTPSSARPIDLRIMRDEFELYAHQDLYFSRICYGEPYPFLKKGNPLLDRTTPIIPLSGIANPSSFHDYLYERYPNAQEAIVLPDHHSFSEKELRHLSTLLAEDEESVILCTEKDAIRLIGLSSHIPTELRHRFYTLPIEVDLSPETTRRILARAHSAIANNGLHL